MMNDVESTKLIAQYGKHIALYVGIILSVTVSIFLVAFALRRYPADKVIIYRQDVVTAANSVLCSGDTLHYQQADTIRFAPIWVDRVVSLWNIEKFTFVPFPGNSTVEHLIFTDNGTTVLNFDWLVPSLPAGRYELRVATRSEGRQQSIYIVPFVIQFSCKAK